MKYTKQQFSNGQVLYASQLNSMDNAIESNMQASLPIRIGIGKKPGKILSINLSNLTPGKNYVIQLYRQQKSSDNPGEWKMMWNEDTESSGFGWNALAGTIRSSYRSTDDGSLVITSTFTDEIPDWMQNSGELVTRWNFTATDTTYSKDIKVSEWVLDMLKPIDSHWEPIEELTYVTVGQSNPTPEICASAKLISTPPKKDSSVKFKVGVMEIDPDGDIALSGWSSQTISIGGRKLSAAHASYHSFIQVEECDDGVVRARNVSTKIL